MTGVDGEVIGGVMLHSFGVQQSTRHGVDP